MQNGSPSCLDPAASQCTVYVYSAETQYSTNKTDTERHLALGGRSLAFFDPQLLTDATETCAGVGRGGDPELPSHVLWAGDKEAPAGHSHIELSRTMTCFTSPCLYSPVSSPSTHPA